MDTGWLYALAGSVAAYLGMRAVRERPWRRTRTLDALIALLARIDRAEDVREVRGSVEMERARAVIEPPER